MINEWDENFILYRPNKSISVKALVKKNEKIKNPTKSNLKRQFNPKWSYILFFNCILIFILYIYKNQAEK